MYSKKNDQDSKKQGENQQTLFMSINTNTLHQTLDKKCKLKTEPGEAFYK